MWWDKKVSRKEFEEFKRKNNDTRCIDRTEYHDLNKRITKLEATLNCRDGKHEWILTSVVHEIKQTEMSIKLGVVGGYVDGTKEYTCKHCAIKKDEWEKKILPTKPTGTISGDEVWGGEGYGKSTMAKNAKPQPKRKKGKK